MKEYHICRVKGDFIPVFTYGWEGIFERVEFLGATESSASIWGAYRNHV